MKKSVILIAMALMASPAFAVSWGDLYRDVRDQTKITVLQGADAGYFYSLTQGTNDASKGGFISHVVNYRFLNADVGWINSLNGKTVGTGVGGGSIDFSKVVELSFPNYTQYVRSFIPETAMKFWNALYLGMYGGWDFDKAAFDWGLHSGLELKF